MIPDNQVKCCCRLLSHLAASISFDNESSLGDESMHYGHWSDNETIEGVSVFNFHSLTHVVNFSSRFSNFIMIIM